jgi:hypothetical protein
VTEAETILKMIETVDPTNERVLDEIDIRTHCWLRRREWGGWHTEGSDMTGSWGLDKEGNRVKNSYLNHSSFTRLSVWPRIVKVVPCLATDQ